MMEFAIAMYVLIGAGFLLAAIDNPTDATDVAGSAIAAALWPVALGVVIYSFPRR